MPLCHKPVSECQKNMCCSYKNGSRLLLFMHKADIFALHIIYIIRMALEFILRITVAALLGGAIGLEREYRDKAAGFRTHFLVALGSALFMIISVYGFENALPSDNHRLDVSRIAAQVVTGIGFIGAGAIVLQKNVVRGLTTAAGIWVTAAIGLACGSGMYALSFAATFLVLLGLEAFNFFLRRVDEKRKHDKSDDKE